MDDDYSDIVLGGFFVRRNGKPTTKETAGIRAIHRDFLKLVQAGREVWNDGGKATKEGGLQEECGIFLLRVVRMPPTPDILFPFRATTFGPAVMIETRSCSFE